MAVPNKHFVAFQLISIFSTFAQIATSNVTVKPTTAHTQDSWREKLSLDTQDIVDIFYRPGNEEETSNFNPSKAVNGVHVIDLSPWFIMEFVVFGEVDNGLGVEGRGVSFEKSQGGQTCCSTIYLFLTIFRGCKLGACFYASGRGSS